MARGSSLFGGRSRNASGDVAPESADPGASAASSSARTILPGEPFEPTPAAFPSQRSADPLLPSGWGPAGIPGSGSWAGGDMTAGMPGGAPDPSASSGDPLDALQQYAGLPLGGFTPGAAPAPAPDPTQLYSPGSPLIDPAQPLGAPGASAAGYGSAYGNAGGGYTEGGIYSGELAAEFPGGFSNGFDPAVTDAFPPVPAFPASGDAAPGSAAHGPLSGLPAGAAEPLDVTPLAAPPMPTPGLPTQPGMPASETLPAETFPAGAFPATDAFSSTASTPDTFGAAFPANGPTLVDPAFDTAFGGPATVVPGSPFEPVSDAGDGRRGRRRGTGRGRRNAARRGPDAAVAGSGFGDDSTEPSLDQFAAPARPAGPRRAIALVGVVAVLGGAGYLGWSQLAADEVAVATGVTPPPAPAPARYALPTGLGGLQQVSPETAKATTENYVALAAQSLPDLPAPLVVSGYTPRSGAAAALDVVVYRPGVQAEATLDALVGNLSRPAPGNASVVATTIPGGAVGGSMLCGAQRGASPVAWCAWQSSKGIGFLRASGTDNPNYAAAYTRELRAYSER